MEADLHRVATNPWESRLHAKRKGFSEASNLRAAERNRTAIP